MEKNRVVVVGLLISAMLLLQIGRLVDLQLVKGQRLAAAATVQHTRSLPLEPFSRGDILDRHCRSLTGALSTYSVVIIPAMLKDKIRAARLLAAPLGVSEHKVLEQLTASSGRSDFRPPFVIRSGLNRTTAGLIEQLGVEGVVALPVSSRYGRSPMAVHLLGHIGRIDPVRWNDLTLAGKTVQNRPFDPQAYRVDDVIGVKGIESIYEEYLHGGQPGRSVVTTVDAHGRIIPGLKFREQQAQGLSRRNVVLTIDRDLQEVVEEVMDRMVPRGAVVVLDVRTRDVLAVASRPGFDPNSVSSYLGTGTASNFRNRAFDPYHPGSIFKVLVAAAALDAGLTNLNEEFTCSGSYRLNSNLSIPCPRAHGKLTLLEAMSVSCNTTFIDVGLRVGRQGILEYAHRTGLDRQVVLGYPLPGAATIAIDMYNPGKVANAALGEEGVRISPLQAALLLATIADDGLYATPRVVKEVSDQNGKIYRSFTAGSKMRIMSPTAARELRLALSAVTQWGTGQEAWVQSWGAGGKTGSAQSGEKDENGRKRTDAWFAGYAPLGSPRLAIAVVVEGGKTGGRAAAPVFREIADRVFRKGIISP